MRENSLDLKTVFLGVILLLSSFYSAPVTDFIFLGGIWIILTGLLIHKAINNELILTLPKDNVSLLMSAFGLILIVNYFTSQLPESTIHVLWSYFAGLTIFFIWRSNNNQNKWKTLWFILLLCGYVFSGFALLDFIKNPGYINGQVSDPNVFAEMILCTLTPLSMVFLSANHNTKVSVFYLVSISLFSFCILLTGSRATLLIGLTSFILVVIFLFAHKRIKTKLLIKFFIALIASWLLFLMLDQTSNSYHLADVTGSSNTAVSLRLLMWKSAFNMYLENPLTGTGLGTFPIQYPAFRSPNEVISSGSTPHNDYLQLLTEGGPTLLFIIICIASVSLWSACSKLFATKTSNEIYLDNKIKFSLLIVILGFCVHALINFIFVNCFLFIITCLYFSIATENKELEARTKLRPDKGLKLPKFLSVSITLILILFLSVDLTIDNIFNPNSKSNYMYTAIDETNHQDIYKTALFLENFRPSNTKIRRYIIQQGSQAYTSNTNQQQKIQIEEFLRHHYQLYLESCEICAVANVEMAEYLLMIGEIEKSNHHYKKAIKQHPAAIDIYISYARQLAMTGRYAESIPVLLNIPPDWIEFSTQFDNINYRTLVLEEALKLAKKHGTSVDQIDLTRRLELIALDN